MWLLNELEADKVSFSAAGLQGIRELIGLTTGWNSLKKKIIWASSEGLMVSL